MVIIGGVGSSLGSFLGAAFVTLLPVLLSVSVRFLDRNLGLQIAESTISNLELMIYGGLIIFFLIVEPHGLARLWQIGKDKLRLWPFPH
jgi:branched-chain amino acid transport system permease protein